MLTYYHPMPVFLRTGLPLLMLLIASGLPAQPLPTAKPTVLVLNSYHPGFT